MHAERDALVRLTFPDLRRRLRAYRIYLDDVDLRWGITREQADNDRALDICLRQIDACRPYFVGLLGERYGWVPGHIPQNILTEFPWLSDYDGCSITELEIWHGMLNQTDGQHRAFFYFRDPMALKAVPPAVRDAVFVDTDPAATGKLSALKDRIRQSGCSLVDGYRASWEPDRFDQASQSKGRLGNLHEFAKRVGNDLWEAIREEYRLGDVPAPPVTDAEMDADEHERFMEERLRVYVSRPEVENALHAYADGPAGGPCLVAGPPGSGKSAILAQFATDYRGTHPTILVLPHFVGAGQRSTGLRDFLRRLADPLHRYAGLGPLTSLPNDPNELVQLFRSAVAACGARPVLLVIDAIDQFDPDDRPHDLHWLPASGVWPLGLRLVCSYLPESEAGETIRASAGSLPHVPIDVLPLTPPQQEEIIRVVPSLSAKTLDAEQIRRLMSNPATANPLYLLVALEELRGFGVYEQVNERIDRFPIGTDAVRAIFGQVLERLEAEHDLETVRSVTTLLFAARRGLSDRELFEVVHGAPQHFRRPMDIYVEQTAFFGSTGRRELFLILRQLRPYLLARHEVTAIYHREFAEAIRSRYLPTPADLTAARRRLADYFSEQNLSDSIFYDAIPRYFPTIEALGGDMMGAHCKVFERFQADLSLYIPRKIDELPWHLMMLGDWQGLSNLLADLFFLSLAWHVDNGLVKAYWARVEVNSMFRLVDAYRATIEAPDQVNWNSLVPLASLLHDNGKAAESLCLWDAIILGLRRDRRGDAALAAEGIFNRALTLQLLGRTDEALAGFKEAERLYRKAGTESPAESWLTGMLLNCAQCLLQSGRQQEAVSLLEEHHRLCRARGARRNLAAGLLALGLIRRDLDDPEGAMARFREVERIARDSDDSEALAAALINEALLLADRGEIEAALTILAEVELLARRTGDIRYAKIAHHNREVFEKDLPLLAGRTTSVSARNQWSEIAVRAGRLEADGRFVDAVHALQEGEQICRQAGSWPYLAGCLLIQARLQAGPLARPEHAVSLLTEARRLVAEHRIKALEPELAEATWFVDGALALRDVQVPRKTLRARITTFLRKLTDGK